MYMQSCHIVRDMQPIKAEAELTLVNSMGFISQGCTVRKLCLQIMCTTNVLVLQIKFWQLTIE